MREFSVQLFDNGKLLRQLVAILFCLPGLTAVAGTSIVKLPFSSTALRAQLVAFSAAHGEVAPRAAELAGALNRLPANWSLNDVPRDLDEILLALLALPGSRSQAEALLVREGQGALLIREATPAEAERFMGDGTLAATVYTSAISGPSLAGPLHKTLLYRRTLPLAVLLPVFFHESVHACDSEQDRDFLLANPLAKRRDVLRASLHEGTASEQELRTELEAVENHFDEAYARLRYYSERKAYDAEENFVLGLEASLPGYSRLIVFYRQEGVFHRLPVTDAWLAERYGFSLARVGNRQNRPLSSTLIMSDNR